MSSLNLKSDSNTSAPIRVENSASGDPIFEVKEGGGGNGKILLGKANGETMVQFSAGSGPSFINNGHVGIGTEDPTAQLSLEGDARIRLLQTDASQDYYWDINYTMEGQFAVQQFSPEGNFVFNGFQIYSDGDAKLHKDLKVGGGLTVVAVEEAPAGISTCALRYDESTGTIYFLRD